MRGADEIRFHIGGAEMRLTFALNNMHVCVLYIRIYCVVGAGKNRVYVSITPCNL